MEIGSSLKEAREARKLSLEEVEEETKIRRKYLQALENEQYDVLPGQVYAKAFLKNYARFLNLDVEEVMLAFDYTPAKELPRAQDSTNISRLESEKKPDSKPRYWLYLAALVIILGVSVAVFYTARGIGWNLTDRGEHRLGEQSQISNDNPSSGEQPAAQGPTSLQEGVRLAFNVTKNSCWIRVVVDGAPAFQGEVPAGQTQEYTGKEKISFRLGNAGVVQVELNGQDLGFLGEEGAVIDREFTSSPKD